jgi:lipoprotein signal peptidase
MIVVIEPGRIAGAALNVIDRMINNNTQDHGNFHITGQFPDEKYLNNIYIPVGI